MPTFGDDETDSGGPDLVHEGPHQLAKQAPALLQLLHPRDPHGHGPVIRVLLRIVGSLHKETRKLYSRMQWVENTLGTYYC